MPAEYQHKVLFWGILGALAMRFVFIFAGVALVHRFEWIIFLFGAVLIVSGIRMGRGASRRSTPIGARC